MYAISCSVHTALLRCFSPSGWSRPQDIDVNFGRFTSKDEYVEGFAYNLSPGDTIGDADAEAEAEAETRAGVPSGLTNLLSMIGAKVDFDSDPEDNFDPDPEDKVGEADTEASEEGEISSVPANRLSMIAITFLAPMISSSRSS